MGIKEVITARKSPWQNPFAERLIGSILRECLDHVIVLNQKHLQKILASYREYYLNAISPGVLVLYFIISHLKTLNTIFKPSLLR